MLKKSIKMKDVFRRGSSLKVYTSAAISKKCFNYQRDRNLYGKINDKQNLQAEPWEN